MYSGSIAMIEGVLIGNRWLSVAIHVDIILGRFAIKNPFAPSLAGTISAKSNFRQIVVIGHSILSELRCSTGNGQYGNLCVVNSFLTNGNKALG